MNDESSVFGVQCSVKNMTARANAAFRHAARKVVLRAKQTGTPVVLWKDGKVVEVAADEFNEPLFIEPGVHVMNLLQSPNIED